MAKARPLSERFSERFERGTADQCWPWTSTKNRAGYGVINSGGPRGLRRPVLAHRVSWTLSVGDIPKGACVLHRCDNPPCVNPAHLFVGTHADNVADKMAKGRYRAGAHSPETCNFTKLNRDAAREIRRRFASGESKRHLATAFGVARQNIHFIVTNKTWKEA